MSTLPRYTWDQAALLHVWSPDAFAAVGINPATVRKWASRKEIQPVGKGPNGCKFYHYDQVVRHAARHTSSSLEVSPKSCHTVLTDGSPMPERRETA